MAARGVMASFTAPAATEQEEEFMEVAGTAEEEQKQLEQKGDTSRHHQLLAFLYIFTSLSSIRVLPLSLSLCWGTRTSHDLRAGSRTWLITATHPSYLSSDTNPTHSSHSQKVEEKEDGVELWCVILSLHSALQQLQAPSTLQALIENTKQWSSSSEWFVQAIPVWARLLGAYNWPAETNKTTGVSLSLLPLSIPFSLHFPLNFIFSYVPPPPSTRILIVLKILRWWELIQRFSCRKCWVN